MWIIKYEYGNTESRDFIGDKGTNRLGTFWSQFEYKETKASKAEEAVAYWKKWHLDQGFWFKLIGIYKMTPVTCAGSSRQWITDEVNLGRYETPVVSGRIFQTEKEE